MANFVHTVFKNKNSKIGQFYDWVQGDNAPPGSYYSRTTDYARGQMFTESHKVSRDGKYRSGGPWLSDKRTYATWGTIQKVYRNGVGLAYVGAYALTSSADFSLEISNAVSGVAIDPNIDSHWDTVNSYGAQAYAALKPDEPDFEPLVSLFELSRAPLDLRRRLQALRRRTRRHKQYRYLNKVGRFHLAVQFGWLPLLRDIQDFTKAFNNRKKRFKQMLRDEGRWVRRRRNLSLNGNDVQDAVLVDNIVHNDPWSPYMLPSHVTQCYGGSGATTTRLDWAQTRVWCAGKARYVLPPGPRDAQWTKKLQKRILGLRVTPETVYNAMPWTWLIDYFSSVGHMVSALSGGIADRVIFDYAYVMHHKVYGIRNTTTQGIRVTKSGATGRATSHRVMTRERKTRIGASPFGFGLTEDDLTPHQAGILSALALTML